MAKMPDEHTKYIPDPSFGKLTLSDQVRLSFLGEEIIKGLQCGAVELEPGRDIPCFSDRMAVCNAMRVYLRIHE